MNPWPIRLAVIGGMFTAFALWFLAAPSYLNACYNFDFYCSNQWLWRMIFVVGPILVGALIGRIILAIVKRVDQ